MARLKLLRAFANQQPYEVLDLRVSVAGKGPAAVALVVIRLEDV
jgi:hypothetical protein